MKKKFNINKSYKNFYRRKKEIIYPAEAVIRIFKGSFPKLKLKFKKKQKILDSGYGDGRHLVFFKKIGLDPWGMEISKDINSSFVRLEKKFNKKKLLVGNSSSIPAKNKFFDFILSWNSIYYMSITQKKDFKISVKELSRVLKRRGKIIVSIPKKTAFIYKKAKTIKKGYVQIKKDFFNMRNGEVMRKFENEKEIKKEFSKYFKNFNFSSVKIDWFGLNYHFHIFIAEKK